MVNCKTCGTAYVLQGNEDERVRPPCLCEKDKLCTICDKPIVQVKIFENSLDYYCYKHCLQEYVEEEKEIVIPPPVIVTKAIVNKPPDALTLLQQLLTEFKEIPKPKEVPKPKEEKIVVTVKPKETKVTTKFERAYVEKTFHYQCLSCDKKYSLKEQLYVFDNAFQYNASCPFCKISFGIKGVAILEETNV